MRYLAAHAGMRLDELMEGCASLLVILTRHEKAAKLARVESLLGCLREVLLSHFGRWETLGLALKVLTKQRVRSHHSS